MGKTTEISKNGIFFAVLYKDADDVKHVFQALLQKICQEMQVRTFGSLAVGDLGEGRC